MSDPNVLILELLINLVKEVTRNTVEKIGEPRLKIQAKIININSFEIKNCFQIIQRYEIKKGFPFPNKEVHFYDDSGLEFEKILTNRKEFEGLLKIIKNSDPTGTALELIIPSHDIMSKKRKKEIDICFYYENTFSYLGVNNSFMNVYSENQNLFNELVCVNPCNSKKGFLHEIRLQDNRMKLIGESIYIPDFVSTRYSAYICLGEQRPQNRSYLLHNVVDIFGERKDYYKDFNNHTIDFNSCRQSYGRIYYFAVRPPINNGIMLIEDPSFKGELNRIKRNSTFEVRFS